MTGNKLLIVVVSAALVATGLLGGCAHDVVRPQSPPCAINGCGSPTYRIGPGDVLQVAVWQDKDLYRTEPVRPDGKISLPLLNDIQAAGLTPAQLRQEIAEGLKQYMSDPDVSVVVTAVHSLAVAVLGQVKKPGRYQFPVEPTVLEVLAAAGGLTPFASPSKIVIIRQSKDGTERIPFNYQRAVSQGSGPVLLQPNDVVVVP
ncbi:MAG: polysaccharide biosynthesis/export family protein [Gammaproteobacteria bacterium]